ncbi:MAG TPA: AAA family ATPase [Pyrinomonadaceae bacterium]|jgi:ATP-dependent Clp protease ATP-binding subunit ClpA
MPTHFFSLTTLVQHFEDETYLTENVNFHEISRFHNNPETAVSNARLNAEQILKDAYANALHTRIAPEAIEVKEVFIEVAPPKKSAAWREKISLRFHVLETTREDGYLSAYVPALGIAVLSKKATEFEEKIRREILSALKRGGYLKSLQRLRWLARVEKISLQRAELAVRLPTTRQRAVAEENDSPEEESVLAETGTDLTKVSLRVAYETEKQTAVLAEIFKASQKSSVLLVGASGVGKTAIFHELVRRRAEFDLAENEFWATGGARLIAGQTGFGMWQERVLRLIAEAKKRNAILHLGNLIELLEVGKSLSSTQGIASFLRPKIARGEMVVVTECTPEQLPVLERRDPNLLGAFQQILLEEPDRKTGLRILESVAGEFAESQNEKDRQTENQAIKTVDAIHRRFSTYSAFPGRPVRFLRNIFQESDADEPLTKEKVYKAFTNETGLPEMLLSDELRLDSIEAEKFFTDRVIGQAEAVKLITNLIATVKAKLTRPRKPIASLLFIGPTGVGKTELTKALAEFFFSDRERLIRFDMSEFSNPLAVQRLIGGTGEAEGQLTAKVREQPFSVILLDEFEKAHHSFFDLLLQMLGEGRLTDSAGRVADFTNSIIVMTSNLGASEFQRGKSGFTRSARERQAAIKHFDAAVKNFLRPEIYNRLDRIVPFAPLDEQTVLKIAGLEIEKLRRRDGLRFRPVKLEIESEVLNYLAETGYDIRYGARPLKRTIERELLAPLSTELNGRAADEKLTINASLKTGKIALRFTTQDEPKKRFVISHGLATNAERIAVLRRRMQKFSASYKLTELSDELYQIARLQAILLRGKWLPDEDRERIERKPKIERFLENVRAFSENVNAFEDEILLEIYGKAAEENQKYGALLKEKETVLQKYLFELLSLQYRNPNAIKFTFFSENQTALTRLWRLYFAYFKEFNCKMTRVLIFTSDRQPDQETEKKTLFDRKVWRREILEIDKFTKNLPANTIGMIIEIEGNLALPRFGAESGIHRFAAGLKSDRVLVGATDASFEKYQLPDDLAKRDSVKFQTERRVYDAPQNQVKDLILNKIYSLENTDLQDIFIKAIDENLIKTSENLIE